MERPFPSPSPVSRYALSPATSLFLDSLRIAAAMGVFLSHASSPWFSPLLRGLPDIGHHCVVVFFVLSGYVIAFATLSKRESFAYYAVARLARLYSVVIPALVLTEVVRWVGVRANPAFFQAYDRSHEWLRALGSLFFLQEIWFFSAGPLTDKPLWSLGYEFWYYVLFGLWIYIRQPRLRVTLLILTAGLIGPKILLLFPQWLVGALGFAYGRRFQVSRRAAVGAFWAFLTGSLCLIGLQWHLPSQFDQQHLCYSSPYLSDFVLGLLVCGTIVFFDRGFGEARMPRVPSALIRYAADRTFSLYLYHWPLLLLAAAVLHTSEMSGPETIAILGGLLLLVNGLSRVTEARKGTVRKMLRTVEQWLRTAPLGLRAKPDPV